jgi:hypothetical protein
MCVEQMINTTFQNIKLQILQTASYGITEYQFTIMCERLPSSLSLLPTRFGSPNLSARRKQMIERDHKRCDNYDGYQSWKKYAERANINLNKNQINKIKKNVLYRIGKVFIDSNLTKTNRDCCDTYLIQW